MALSLSVVCPACEAVLKVTKPSLVGKRVACPSCQKPVLIEAPVEPPKEAAPPKRREAAKSKEAAAPKPAPRAMSDDPDTILLAEDDDLVGHSAAKSSAAKSSATSKPSAPAAKPRRSAVWKTMEETETAEFEAMLVDSEDDDAPTVELPFNDGEVSSDRIRASRKGEESGEVDSIPLETDAEQDRLTEEMPATRRTRQKKASKSKRSARAKSDAFDAGVADSEMDDGEFAAQAPRPPRRSAMKARSRGPSATQKLPLIIGAFVGCSLLMGLLLYSISGGHAPPKLPQSPAGDAASGKEDSAAEEKNDATDTLPAKAGANLNKPAGGAIAAGDQSEQDGKERDSGSPGQPPGQSPGQAAGASPGDSGRSLPASKGLAATTGFGVGGKNEGASQQSAANADGPAVADGAGIGRKIPSFSATAVDNTTFQAADLKQKVLVVAFLGVECPLANLYYPRLVELAHKYKGKSVGFVVVNSNAQDTFDGVQAQARTNGATFPVLKDASGAVAKTFAAERTPEVFVLDADRTVRYHGMVDDQYGIRQRRSQPTKNYVADAVDAILASQTVSVAETPVQGCHIGRVTKASETAHTSFYRDVLPVLQNRCQQCHRKGEIGPFALKDFAEVRDWGPTIREAVAERRMPPWGADPHIGKFSNDISMTPAEIETIEKWVDDGCPEGNAAEKPAEKKFVEGWNIGKPDKVFAMERPFHVPATGVIEYQNFYVSPVFTQDSWVQAVECRFGNRSVVHHMLVLLDFPNDRSKSQDGLVKGFFAAGAPGSTYFTFPKGYAKRIPKGARLRFQMHYTPNGRPADDISKFGVVLAKEPKHREVQTYALGKLDINIPAGNPDHVESATQNLQGEVMLTTLMPHLHVRGKSFTYTVVWPNGKKETILSVPRWDFNWQPQYQLAKPIVLPKNSQIIVEAHWDNSADNPNNILPPVDVQFGEQTFDEMFIGYVNFIPKSMADATRSRGRTHGG